MALLDRLKGILLDPKNEWPKIAAEPATTQSLYTGWIMIFAAIGPLAMLAVGGGATIMFAIGTYIMALIIAFILALIVDAVTGSFGGAKDFVAALKLAAFSSTASAVAGIFTVLGLLGGVLALLAYIYSWYTFYLGAPILKKCSLDKAVVFTIVVLLCWIGLWLLFSLALGGLGFIPRMGGLAMAR